MFGLMRKSTHVERTQHAVFAQMALLMQARYERDLALERVERALTVCGVSKGTTVGKRAIEDALAVVPVPEWVQALTEAREVS